MNTKDLDQRIQLTAKSEVNRMRQFNLLEYGQLDSFIKQLMEPHKSDYSSNTNVNISDNSTVNLETLRFVSKNISSILAIYHAAINQREVDRKFNELQGNILSALDRALNGEPNFDNY